MLKGHDPQNWNRGNVIWFPSEKLKVQPRGWWTEKELSRDEVLKLLGWDNSYDLELVRTVFGLEQAQMFVDENGQAKNLPVNLYGTILYNHLAIYNGADLSPGFFPILGDALLLRGVARWS